LDYPPESFEPLGAFGAFALDCVGSRLVCLAFSPVGSPPMALSLAEDAIALLISMAEQGEIDPWDVKVIEVIDRFLGELAPSDSLEPYEKSLSSSGQAFLYASMLVLLKADSLTQPDTTADESEELSDMDFLAQDDTGTSLPPYLLERQLRRRAVAQPLQRRRVTLKDLIDQLRSIAKALDDPEPRKRIRRPPAQSRSQTVRAIAQLAHQENLSEMAAVLEQFFVEHWEATQVGQNWVDFDLLLDFWVEAQDTGLIVVPMDSHAPKRDRVGIFWALLLLSAQSKVELHQEEFYQDLQIRPASLGGANTTSQVSEGSA
jgi:segregation and condensation protein A